jgi:hypothetical protein
MTLASTTAGNLKGGPSGPPFFYRFLGWTNGRYVQRSVLGGRVLAESLKGERKASI